MEVNFVCTIRAIVSGLAIAGLLLAPLSVAADVMPSGSEPAMTHQSGLEMLDMPCCPEEAPKGCPYMAICMGSCFQHLPCETGLLVSDSLASIFGTINFATINDPSVKGFGPEPPGKPPKI